jgi:hypothetical protein
MTDGESHTPTDTHDWTGTLDQIISLAAGVAPIVVYLNGWVGFEIAALWYLAVITLLISETREKTGSMP